MEMYKQIRNQFFSVYKIISAQKNSLVFFSNKIQDETREPTTEELLSMIQPEDLEDLPAEQREFYNRYMQYMRGTEKEKEEILDSIDEEVRFAWICTLVNLSFDDLPFIPFLWIRCEIIDVWKEIGFIEG